MTIENSPTFFRVAAAYLKISSEGVDGVNVGEFSTTLSSFDGYDTYKISDNEYIRFNNTSFVSNYKRNDLLTTTMDMFCIPVGVFTPEDFDFLKQIERMNKLMKHPESFSNQSLADIYPIESECMADDCLEKQIISQVNIYLYDVVYASTSEEIQ